MVFAGCGLSFCSFSPVKTYLFLGGAALDNTDMKILEILQKNGRIPMNKLASMISMSTPSTAERVKKQEERGVIAGYKAVVDPAKAGRPINAFVLVAPSPENRDKFYAYIKDQDSIVEFYELTGRYPVCLRLSHTDMTSFLKMFNEIYTFGLSETYIITSNPI